MSTLYRGEQGPLTVEAFEPTYVGNLGVELAAGSLIVNGTQQGDEQGAYVVQAVGTTVVTLDAAGGSRTDWIIARVYDEDYDDDRSETVLEVIADVGGVNAATLPANSYLIAAVSFITGEPLTADSVVDRRGPVVFPGSNESAPRGVIATMNYERPDGIAELYPAGQDISLGEFNFQARPDRSYTFSLYTGRWPRGDERSFTLDITWSQGNDRPQNIYHILRSIEEYGTAVLTLSNLDGRVDVDLRCLFVDAGQKSFGAPLALTVREDF